MSMIPIRTTVDGQPLPTISDIPVTAEDREFLAISAAANTPPVDPGYAAWHHAIIAELTAIRDVPSPAPDLEDGTVGGPRGEKTAFLATASSNDCEQMPVFLDDLYSFRYGDHPVISPTREHPELQGWAQTNENMMAAMQAGWCNPLTRTTSVDTWLDRIRAQHGTSFQHLAHAHPGCWKPHRVVIHGTHAITITPDPEHTEPLLRAGYNLVCATRSAWRRAAMLEFLIVRVHPFVDGNGRLSRIVANDAMPTVRVPFRPTMDNYIAGLETIEIRNDPTPWLQQLAQWQRRSATVDQRHLVAILKDWARMGWTTGLPHWHIYDENIPAVRRRQARQRIQQNA